jgi:AcrR family transcriptional regulator
MSTRDEMSSTPPYTSEDTGDARERQREECKARILTGARDRYMRGQSIELTALAAEHGVGRATAYRWFGDNERVLAEVLGERARENFGDRIREHADRFARAASAATGNRPALGTRLASSNLTATRVRS